MKTESPWSKRIGDAEQMYRAWTSLYKCDTLERYYKGFHWKNRKDPMNANYNPYTINLFYSTIKIKLANILFQKPTFVVNPRPGNSDYNLDFAVQSAQLKQDTLNTLTQNPNMNFVKHTKLAALDSFFRFGMIEVGYAADWRNPAKTDPHLKSWDDTTLAEGKDRTIEENEVPINERMYIKRIPAKRFRVSVSEATELSDHEWCGYYEYQYSSVLQKTKGIKWPKEAEGSISERSSIIDAGTETGDEASIRILSMSDVKKIWHIWDLVSHKRMLFLDNYFAEPMWEDNSERLPLIDIRWDLHLEGFYPIPPCFQWISPQDEINESREQARSYRRRFTRKFQAQKGEIDESEKEKFAAGPDGIIIEVKTKDAISPISNPDQNNTEINALLVAKDDFNIISGTSSEARGAADRETATQSKIKDMRSQIRESSEQMDFSNCLCLVAREILCQAAERMTSGLWIRYTQDPGETVQDMSVAPLFKYISAQDVSDGYDFDIDVDIQNATPAAMQASQQAFLTFVSLMSKIPMLSLSPILIREAAYRCGYRNEAVIHQMQQVAVMQMAAQAATATGSNQPGGGQPSGASNMAKEQIAQQAPPTNEAVDVQLDQQLGVQ